MRCRGRPTSWPAASTPSPSSGGGRRSGPTRCSPAWRRRHRSSGAAGSAGSGAWSSSGTTWAWWSRPRRRTGRRCSSSPSAGCAELTGTRFDVAVVGGGPAGAAAATVLAAGGAGVVVVERSSYAGFRVGETLPPDVRLPLERLGAWDRFCAAGHLPSPGVLAAWGAATPHANDFILHPHGCGWRVDRNRFDAMLVAGAQEAGAVIRSGAAVDA